MSIGVGIGHNTRWAGRMGAIVPDADLLKAKIPWAGLDQRR